MVVVTDQTISKQTSQQVTEPNNSNSLNSKTCTSTREITREVTPIKDVVTKVKFTVEFTCENDEKVRIVFMLPMSKFMDEYFDFKDNFNAAFGHYIKKSMLYLHGCNQEQRRNINEAITTKEYMIIGITEDMDGDIKHQYIDYDTNEHIEAFFCETVEENGGYGKCPQIDILVIFPILAIDNDSYATSPFGDDYSKNPFALYTTPAASAIQSRNHVAQSPNQGRVATSNRYSPLVETVDEPDTPTPPSPLRPNATPYNHNWRNAPLPAGPWKHSSVSHAESSSTQAVVPPSVPNTSPTLSHYPAPLQVARPYHQVMHPSLQSMHTPSVPSQHVPTIFPPVVSHPGQDPSFLLALAEFGVLNPHDYCDTLNATKIDTKSFKKKENVPTQGDSSLITWYRQFSTHALSCGVYVPPFESLTPVHNKGLWYDGVAPSVKAQATVMSSCILAAVIQSQAINAGADLNSFKNETCGYVALANLMSGVHPRLSASPIVYHQPRQRPNEDISDYIARWKEYALLEYVCGRPWRRVDITTYILTNLQPQHSLWAQQHYDSLMLSQGHSYDTPPAYHLTTITRTLRTVIKKNPHQQHQHSHQQTNRHNHSRSAHALQHFPDSYDDECTDIVTYSHAVHGVNDGDKHCPLCDHTSHNLIDCHKYITYCLCTQYAKSNPQSVPKILQQHKHPPKMHRSSTRPTSSHALTTHTLSDHNADNDDGDNDDDNPDRSTNATSVVHSICAHLLTGYNEDDSHSDDESIDPHCIASIGFDFDTPFAYQPSSYVASAELTYDTTNTIVHSVDNETQEITQAIGGQFDSGANMNTTNILALLWNVHKLKTPRYTVDAGQTRHEARYRGYLVLPCTRHGVSGYLPILTYYTPSIGVTLIAPSAIRDQYSSLTSWTITDADHIASTTFFNTSNTAVVAFALYPHNSLHWTAPFVRPSVHHRQAPLPSNISMSITTDTFIDTVDTINDDMLMDDLTEFPDDTPSPYSDENVSHVSALRSRTLYQIWHQRLGHIQPRTVTDLHKHVDGIPTLPTPTILDNCPICITSKMQRADSSRTDSRVATQCYQSLSIDMAFIVQKSKSSDRFIDNVGLKGETCYVLITDYYSGMLHGKTLVSKGPPTEYFNQWLARFSPDITEKTVRFDQGGELGRCRRIIKLFQDFGYTIQLTGADSSHQNGSVERSHRSIGNMIRSLLHGADLPRKFWPYAFYHSLFIMNRIMHHDKPLPPITACSGKRISLEALRVFGCRVYIRLPGERKAKLDSHTASGIFLGYNETMKNIYWYDPDSNLIKTASHVRFDEGMADVPDPPPNVQLLQRVEHDNIMPDPTELAINPVDFQLDSSPFRTIDTLTIDVICDSEFFGFVLGECNQRHRAYISDISPNTSASRIRNIRHKYIGSYVVEIHNIPTFDLSSATDALATIRRDPTILQFKILLAPDKYIAVRNRREPLRINTAQLREITNLRLRHPTTAHSIAAISPSLLQPIIPITSAEARIQHKLTRLQLLKLDTWPLWRLAEHKQLDAHHAQSMFGPPIIPPSTAIILRPHWRYKIKPDGTRSARECCDGSPRAAPELHQDAITYASCIELPCMRLFFALAAVSNYFVLLTDAVNAYANARGPTKPTYIRVDAAYADWYLTRTGSTIPHGSAVLAQHALQGHPEAGRLFEELANDILLNRLGLTTTSHERNLYCGLFESHKVYVCRQVDDLAISAPSIEIGQRLIAAIGSHVTLAGNSLLTKFNGIQVEQSREYIRLHCTDYIDRLVERYGWSTPSTPESSHFTAKEPMNTTVYKQLDTDTGPPEHSPEGLQLAQSSGFQYRALLGTLIYAYVICRLDIGYALTKLSQYSQHPAPIHYTALKHVALYLRSTRTWGIMYWRPVHLPDLPPGSIADLPVPVDHNLPPFPIDHLPTQLVAYVDAAHANDAGRRSITGFVLSFCAGAICYRSKVQASTAISSTEAELVASVLCAKAVKYMRSVLADLDFTQHDPTPIYEDNEASILIVNASKPTPRTRHIDIQYFAIQEWKALGLLFLLSIAGVINIADALTKALGWILHHRHARRAMGHHACQYRQSPDL